MKTLRILPFIFGLIVCPMLTKAQSSLRLENLIESAHKHYPLSLRDSLINQSQALELKNLSNNYLPSLSLEAKATWQSDVTEINLPIPGLEFPEFPQDQYRLSVDIRQLIWDGGLTQTAKRIEKGKADLAKEQWKTSFTALDQQINNLYHGILLMNENEKSLYAALQRLSNQKNWLQTLHKNGMANMTQVNEIAIEELKVQQAIHELHYNRQEALQSLKLLCGEEYQPNQFSYDPSLISPSGDKISRSEIRMIEKQSSLFELQKQVQDRQRMPRIAAFTQLGYGKPGLNMFSTEFNEYALLGVQVNWTIYDWGQRKNNQQKISLEQEKLNQEKALFEQNLQIRLNNYDLQYKRLQTQANQQAELLNLRKDILRDKDKQVKEGTLLMKDYLDQLNQLLMEEVKHNELKIKSIQVLKASRIERGTL